MRRRLEGTIVRTGLTAAIALASISAAPPPGTTTVTLSCERNVASANATVDLKLSLFDPAFDTVSLSCGTESTSGLKTERIKVTTGKAGAFSYNVFVENASGSGGCAGASVAGTVECDPGSPPGVKLVVR